MSGSGTLFFQMKYEYLPTSQEVRERKEKELNLRKIGENKL